MLQYQHFPIRKNLSFWLMLIGCVYLLLPQITLAYSKSYNIPPAIYTSWSGPNAPVAEYTGYDVAPVMSEVWTAPQTVNWSVYENQINSAQTINNNSGWQQQPISLVIPPQNLNVGGIGTAENPFNNLYAPNWAQSLIKTINTDRYTYQTWSWADLTPHMIWFVTQAGSRYNSDPRIGVIRLYLGFEGETQPVKECQNYWLGGSPCLDSDPVAALKTATSSPADCGAYQNYVFEVGKAAVQAFPNKPVVVMAQTSGCSSYSDSRWRQELYDKWRAEQLAVGYSANSMAADWAGAEGYRPQVNWSSWLTYQTLDGFAPLSTETTIYSSWSSTLQAVQTYWAGLTAQALQVTSYFSPREVLVNAPQIFFQDWDSYAQNKRVSVILRDRQFGGESWDGQNGASGLRGNLNIGAHQTNQSETPQACGTAYQRSIEHYNQISSAYKEQTCLIQMPSFASSDGYQNLYNWQARLAAAGRSFKFSSDTDWARRPQSIRIIAVAETAGSIQIKADNQTFSQDLQAGQWRVMTFQPTSAQNIEVINQTAGKLYLHRVDWFKEGGISGDDQPNNNCQSDRRADINCDGRVDLGDYSILLSRLNF